MQREAHVVTWLPRVEEEVRLLAVEVEFDGNIPKRQLEGLKCVNATDLMDLLIPDPSNLTRTVEFVTPGGCLRFSRANEHLGCAAVFVHQVQRPLGYDLTHDPGSHAATLRR
jgi:hypothetical protein